MEELGQAVWSSVSGGHEFALPEVKREPQSGSLLRESVESVGDCLGRATHYPVVEVEEDQVEEMPRLAISSLA